MSAQGLVTDWLKKRYVAARCPECGGRLEGAEQDNGIWCEASVLVVKTSPLGLDHYVATCDTSAHHETCDRAHLYICTQRACRWAIIV